MGFTNYIGQNNGDEENGQTSWQEKPFLQILLVKSTQTST